jgi:hypothetical protein
MRGGARYLPFSGGCIWAPCRYGQPDPPGVPSRRPQSTATCVYALAKADGGRGSSLHHSSAGHPPPLLTTEEGDTRYLDASRGPLIGMDPELPRTSARDRLPPHSTLLLYTDGLIERPGESLDDAMTRLRRHTAEQARDRLDVFCDELIIEFGAGSTDDIALLALRPTPLRLPGR